MSHASMSLPLAPFEHFMWADDSPDHPMSFFIQLKFQGRFDRALLHGALKLALAQHPLLHSLIRGSVTDVTSDITWVPSDAPPPLIDWHDADVPLRFAGSRWIDLKTATGLRLWLRESENATKLVLQVHHCCCDGLGATSFIQTLLLAYHLLHESASTATLERMFDPQLLRDRDSSCASWRQILKTAWHAIFRISRFFKSRPMPLAAPLNSPLASFDDELVPEFHTFTFDAEETEQLQVTANLHGVTLNDLLLRDLFVVLNDWNKRHAPDHQSRTIRVSIPVNLRRTSDRRMPAANAISLSFLNAEPDQFTDQAALLSNLHAHTKETKRLRRFLSFVPALKLLGLFRGQLYARTSRPKCTASAALSNLGVVGVGSPLMGRDRRLVSGGILLESIEAVLPLRPLTHAGIIALNYGRELSLTISYDPNWIDSASGIELLENLVQQLKATITQPSSLPAAAT